MTTVTQSLANEIAVCSLCDSAFADPLAWCAHRPWKSVTHRDGCKWPRALRKSFGVWSLRPSCREAVELAEDGPVAEFRIIWPTLNPASKNTRKRPAQTFGKNDPSVYAASRESLGS